jgi:hyperosmotically inducible periplasmic protein
VGSNSSRGRDCSEARYGNRTAELIGPARYYLFATHHINMKMSIPALVTILALSGGVAALHTGCAGTATRTSTGEFIDDATITTKVKAAFVRDPVVSAFDVSVDTFRSVVQLSGFVNTEEERVRAEQIAAGIAGVSSVQNRVSVKTEAAPPAPAATQPAPAMTQPAPAATQPNPQP